VAAAGANGLEVRGRATGSNLEPPKWVLTGYLLGSAQMCLSHVPLWVPVATAGGYGLEIRGKSTGFEVQLKLTRC
jgi:hypothetical protein